MQILHTLTDFTVSNKNISLTIGNFDGLHLGHQLIIQHTKTASQGISTVLTFSNHPSTVISPDKIPTLITSREHKIALFQKTGIDILLILPFSKELAEKSPSEFLSYLKEYIPFNYLILGENATIGKNREGNQQKVIELSQQMNFQVDYVKPLYYQETLISSSMIRQKIKEGNLTIASQLLGRKYSFYSHIVKGEQKGKTLGFPTANMDVSGLCLPPFGVYAIRLLINNKMYYGIANLGFAPTLSTRKKPVLEAHIFNFTDELYHSTIEIIPDSFLRPEIQFDSKQELIDQISQDIAKTKQLFQLT